MPFLTTFASATILGFTLPGPAAGGSGPTPGGPYTPPLGNTLNFIIQTTAYTPPVASSVQFAL